MQEEEEKKVEEVKQEDQEDDPNEHRLYYDTIRMTKNSEGKKVLNEIFTLENKIGSGGFCDVIRCNGYFEDTDETVPYALKEYRTATLN